MLGVSHFILGNISNQKDYDFWQFSTHPGYVRVCGKLQNRSKIAPGGLWKCAFFFTFSEN